MAKHAQYYNQAKLRLAGIPALGAALILTINCCSAPGSSALNLLAEALTPAASLDAARAGHCHGPAAERTAHHEKPDQKPTTPVKPERSDCPGCDAAPVVAHLDSQRSSVYMSEAGHDPEPAFAVGDLPTFGSSHAAAVKRAPLNLNDDPLKRSEARPRNRFRNAHGRFISVIKPS